MKKVFASLTILAAVFCLHSGAMAQDCTEGVKVGHGQAADGRAIEIRLHLRDGAVYKLEVLGGCDPVFIENTEGTGMINVTNSCSFHFTSPILDWDFMGTINGEEFFTDELPPIGVCGTTFGGPVTAGASPTTPGTGGAGGTGGGDDDDDDDGTGGTNGNGERLVGRRVGLDNLRPVAELLGIDVEINPPTVDMRRIASGIADVSITARLIWSNDNLPKDFVHDPTQWNFLTPNANGEWPAWESVTDWGSSLRNRVSMEVRTAPDPEAENPKDAPMVWNFGMERTDKVKSLHLPIRAAYRTVPGEPKSEIDTIVNLRVENPNASGALATSTGPSARNVTFRRILE